MSYKTRGLTFDQFNPGDMFVSQARTVNESDVSSFAGLSGDYNPLHTDAEFGKTTPFGERIAHGMLVAAIASGMANWLGIFEGTTIALMEQVIQYRGAVKFGDTVHLELQVLEKKETSKPGRGVVIFETRVINQKGDLAIEGKWTLMMKREESTVRSTSPTMN
ncbi:MAG TPA: MaoC/PaaZ C-terminal domain-containing protein [Anaerolineae bacterium]